MDVNLFFDNGILDIHINGELDANSSIQLDEVIKEALEQGKTKIIVNCLNLNYISSAGLGVFISHHDDLNKAGGKFIFYSMNESVFGTFKILGLNEIMSVTETEAMAKTMMLYES
jgi:anti-sigma B factor antagonist